MGLIRTCANCGYCTYMDRDGQVTEEQRILEERIVTHMETETRPREENEVSQEAAERSHAEQWEDRSAVQQAADSAITQEEEADSPTPEGPGIPPISMAGTECREDNKTPPAGETPEENRETCAQCNMPREAEHDLRFIRGPLRNCGNCGAWEVNPAFQEDLSENHSTTAVVLQTSCSGVSPHIVEKVTEQVTGSPLPKNTLPNRCRRYGGPPAELIQELKATTGSQWNLTGFEIKRGRVKAWCWAVADSTTQYILATAVTTENHPGEELLQEALGRSSQTPEAIKLTSQSPPMTQEQMGTGGKGWRILRETGPEDRNSSLGKLRQAMENRFGSNVGPALRKSMVEEILQMACMSINLLEPSPMLSGATPAEAAMAEPPFSNWTELAEWSGSQRPVRSRTARKPENREGNGASNGDNPDASATENEPEATDSGRDRSLRTATQPRRRKRRRITPSRRSPAGSNLTATTSGSWRKYMNSAGTSSRSNRGSSASTRKSPMTGRPWRPQSGCWRNTWAGKSRTPQQADHRAPHRAGRPLQGVGRPGPIAGKRRGRITEEREMRR